MSHRWILSLALTSLAGLPALAQSVISAHSGLVNLSEGSVFLDDQRVEQKTGKFGQMNNGSELRTEDGRAEVLLTPGTFLRVGANSAIRMLSNKLDNTRVELLRGSAVLDQGSDTLADTSVTIVYALTEVLIKQPGQYRFDAEPPQVKVTKGGVEVTANNKTIEAGSGTVVPFDGKLVARTILKDSVSKDPSQKSGDDLDSWSASRDNSVAQDSQDAASTSDLAGVIDGWQNNPDSVLQSLGIPPYIPGMSSVIPPPSYGSLYGYGVSSPALYGLYGSGIYGSALYGPGLYGSGIYGSMYGPITPLFVYGVPLYRGYGAYGPSSIYRGLGTYTGRSGFGYPGRTGFGATHPIGTMRPGIGVGVGVGARPVMGGAHVGGMHVGGVHR